MWGPLKESLLVDYDCGCSYFFQFSGLIGDHIGGRTSKIYMYLESYICSIIVLYILTVLLINYNTFWNNNNNQLCFQSKGMIQIRQYLGSSRNRNRLTCVSKYIYIYMCVCVCVCMYIQCKLNLCWIQIEPVKLQETNSSTESLKLVQNIQ